MIIVNRNPDFLDGSAWSVEKNVWNVGSSGIVSTHEYGIAVSKAYAKVTSWGEGLPGKTGWANTEFVQGTKPWGTRGQYVFSPVSLVRKQQINVKANVVEDYIDYWDWLFCKGHTSCFIDLWVKFPSPAGSVELLWAEFLIYLRWHSATNTPMMGQFRKAIYRSGNSNDPVGDWYFVGYRLPQDINSYTGVSGATISLDNFVNALKEWNVDVSKGAVTSLTVGVEATRGVMAAYFDKLYYMALN